MWLRLQICALAIAMSGAIGLTFASASPVLAYCWYEGERSSTVHAYPDPYSSWINVVYFRYRVCDGVRRYIYVRHIDTRFYTSANPPFRIQRRLVSTEIRKNEWSYPAWSGTGGSCYNACTIYGSWDPGVTITYSTEAVNRLACQNCFPATGGTHVLWHHFVTNTYRVESVF